jgi:hypothetical protein
MTGSGLDWIYHASACAQCWRHSFQTCHDDLYPCMASGVSVLVQCRNSCQTPVWRTYLYMNVRPGQDGHLPGLASLSVKMYHPINPLATRWMDGRWLMGTVNCCLEKICSRADRLRMRQGEAAPVAAVLSRQPELPITAAFLSLWWPELRGQRPSPRAVWLLRSRGGVNLSRFLLVLLLRCLRPQLPA